MNIDRILQLAYDQALAVWHQRKIELEESPNNRIRQSRERSAWTELKEVETISQRWRGTK